MSARIRPQWMSVLVALVAATTVSACGGGNGAPPNENVAAPQPTARGTSSPAPTRTFGITPGPTQTLTPTTSPTQTSGRAVSGVLVLQRSVSSNRGDALDAPPAEWVTQPDAASFDKALSFADFSVVGTDLRGATTADGRFVLTGLAPGHYVLSVNKALDGNLAAFLVPFTVGDDGTADIIAEVGLGQVKSISTFTRAGVRLVEVVAPNGAHVVTSNGRIAEIGDGTRVLIDPDGDGHFRIDGCTVPLSVCELGETCPSGTQCQCLASCPFCEDCGLGVCAPAGRTNPYRCNEDGSCKLPGDICRCVPSCPACDDCRASVCVPICDEVEITAITIASGPSQLILGQRGQFTATAQLSDGTVIDATSLVTWQSSNTTVASIDSWGSIVGLSVGGTYVTAALGELTSPREWPVLVVARPPLRKIYLQNLSCIYPLGRPIGDAAPPVVSLPPDRGGILPVPDCTNVVLIGGTIQFQALGEFDNGYYEDITKEVTWRLDPAGVGDVVDGLFTGRRVGTTTLTAALGEITSDGTSLTVVAEASVVALSIYANNGGFAVVDSRVDANGERPEPCVDCGYTIPVLRGDQLRFQATAQYDVGGWRDVTDEVDWHSSNREAAPIDEHGVMTAVAAGDAVITATLSTVTSNAVTAHVVNEATLQSLSIYQEGFDRVVAMGERLYFRATGYYDIGIARDVTREATWRSSNAAAGDFESPGVFVARGGGFTTVGAELDGRQSDHQLGIEVFETGELSYCDPARVNRAEWSDFFNRVTLESDCDHYDAPGVVALRYTVTEIQPHGGIFDPCLDLYVFRDNERVRTIREEGCGDPFLPMTAPGRDQEALKYQTLAFWDLKDERGNPVPDGVYQIVGRFYLYYDPVVTLNVTVGSGGDQTGLADLVPTGAFLNAPSPPGGCVPPGGPFHRATLDVCIANRGTRSAGGFVVNVTGSGEFNVSGLAAGAERCLARPLPYFGTEVTVDTTNAVPESNEDNNRASFPVPVLTPPPTCSPSSGTPTPTPALGDRCCAPGDACIPERPQCCGGFAGTECPAGQRCVDDPSDNCVPPNGADCPGVCGSAPECLTDSDCYVILGCQTCADGSLTCPRAVCEGGVCQGEVRRCPTGPGPRILVEPITAVLTCEGRLDIRIRNIGDAPLLISSIELSNAYSQGEYGTGFTWDASQIEGLKELAAGATVSIAVKYREQGFPRSRLVLAIESNALNNPHVFQTYHGTGCGTPTPTLPPRCCMPGDRACAPGVPQCCAGIAGIACPEGQVCIDDPADTCAPPEGADCGGICVPGQQACTSDADCPAIGAPCQLCSDGSAACPHSSCESGQCRFRFDTCEPPPPTPVPEGVCGPTACRGGGQLWSQEACCYYRRTSAISLEIDWCPLDAIDPATRECHACGDPCAGLPTPTPIPPPSARCCVPGQSCIPELPQCCGGIAGLGCPEGQTCVDDPTDQCDPNTGAADCFGVCVANQPEACTRDADCPPSRAPCVSCSDGSEACPTSVCVNGACQVKLASCVTPTPTAVP